MSEMEGSSALEDPLEATALPSLLTSACMITLMWKFTSLGDLSLIKLAFFMILPTLSALACLQDKRFLATFKRLFQWYILRNGDYTLEDTQSITMVAQQAARKELFKSMSDRWPTANPRGLSLSRFRPTASAATLHASSSEANVLSGSWGQGSAPNSSSGKSLYDQVRAQLKDHLFPSNLDAPIYFMDPATGHFLRVNEQHKLVFTNAPDASCLFHVVKGKTHHWGFHSTIHQLYLGQNFMGKVVVNSKKMNSWEAFRVLQRPSDNDGDINGTNGTTKTIYLVLCSARFGKGMWVGRHRRRTASNPTDTYLTKNFANALALVYASDLSAFEYLAQHKRNSLLRGAHPLAATSSAPSAELPAAAAPVPVAMLQRSTSDPFGDSFQTPVLASAERARVVLPWIEDVTSKRFFELADRQMVDVVHTTIARVSVREFIEFFIDQDARRMCHQKTSQAPPPPRNSSSINANIASSGASAGTVSDQSQSQPRSMSEWHLHPHFGFVRKLSYRPPASQAGEQLPWLAASIAIDQYHACTVDEKTMQKASFRSKMYTLSIPNSNGFSIETLFEFQDTHDRDRGTHALQLRCRTGVHFTRQTMFAPQIEKGVIEGVKNTCEILLQLAHELRQRREGSSSGGGGSTSGSGQSRPAAESAVRMPREVFPPQTLAVEVINGMVNAVRGRTMASSTSTEPPPSRTRSSLVIHMPWTPAALSIAPATSGSSSTSTTHVRPRVAGFFESSPQAFECVVEEPIRVAHHATAITPSLVFDALLSDECSFFHVVHKNSGTMDVDIGAWRSARFPVENAGVAYVRKQLFRMPVSGVAGLDVVHVEDYQYYSLQKQDAAPNDSERLEFGMKIFAKELPDGEAFSIEVLVVVDKANTTAATAELDDAVSSPSPPPCMLRVSYAIAKTASTSKSAGEDDPLHSAVVHGTVRGLKAVWKRVVLVIQDAARRLPRNSGTSSAPPSSSSSPPAPPPASLSRTTQTRAYEDDLRQRLQFEGQLPSHDELSSKIVESIAALY